MQILQWFLICYDDNFEMIKVKMIIITIAIRITTITLAQGDCDQRHRCYNI